MNKQAQTFARQVQVDLLGLSDVVLFQIVHLWVSGGPSGSVSEETRSALGYTPRESEPYTRTLSKLPESEGAGGTYWLAPAPQEMRRLLMDMDVPFFVQYVLPLAFQALHEAHPEWGDGATFNAHLANHFRWIGARSGKR